jgi:hypothetical protein
MTVAEGSSCPEELEKTVSRLQLTIATAVRPGLRNEPHRLSEVRSRPITARGPATFSTGTLYGIRVDENMNAVDNNGNPIPGVCGRNDSGGYYAHTYVYLVTRRLRRAQYDIPPEAARVLAGQ